MKRRVVVVERELESKVDQTVLRWFGLMESTDEHRMAIERRWWLDGRSKWRAGTR